MAKDPKPLEDLNAQAERAVEETKQATDRMKQSVEETKEQALGAADTYFDFLNKTISSFPSGGTEFGEKLKSFAEKNVAATHQFIQQLSQAKDFQDVLRIITLDQPGLALPLVIECVGQNRFLIASSPTRGGWPTQAISQKRVELSQAEMRSRASARARSNRLAS